MKLSRVPKTATVYYQREREDRVWTHRYVVASTKQFHLTVLMETELSEFQETVGVKIANRPVRSTGIYLATCYFASERDALTFRSRHDANDHLIIIGPGQRSAEAGSYQNQVSGTRPQADDLPQIDEGQATRVRQLVAEEQDMALHLHGLALAGVC